MLYCTGAFPTKERREGEVRCWPPTPGATARNRTGKGKERAKAQDGKQPSGQQTHQPVEGRKESQSQHESKTKKKIIPRAGRWRQAGGGSAPRLPIASGLHSREKGHVRLAKANGSSWGHVSWAGPRMESKSVIPSELCTWSVVD